MVWYKLYDIYMIWYMIRYDIYDIWYDTTWYDMMICYKIWYDIWYDTIRYDIRHGMI